MASIQGEMADFVLTEYNANPAFVQQKIEAAEGGLEGVLTQIFSNVKPTGIAAVIAPYLEKGIEGFVTALIAKYTPQQLYALIGSWLAAETKALGG